MQTLRNAENTRSFNNDKGIICLLATAIMSALMQSWAELCKLFHNADST